MTPQDLAAAPGLLLSLCKAHPDVVIVVDERGTIVYVNERCRSLLGYEPSDLIGEPIERLVPGDADLHRSLRERYQRDPRERTMGNRPVLSARHKSGATVPVDIVLGPLPPVPGYEGRLVQAVVRDAAPRWDVHEELLVRSVAMDAAANGIVITDKDGVIQWVNPAVTRMTGYALAELVGQHTRIFKSGKHDSVLYAELWRTVTSGETWYGELANRRKDGSIYYEEQHIAPVRDDAGNTTHYIAIKQDITARKRAEAEAERRLAEIEQLQTQLREQAIRDPLTNLFNRRYLDDTLHRETARVLREGAALSVMLIDVDHFKRVNDSAGHEIGDAVLRTLGQVLTNKIRASDFAVRMGGDEFLVVLPGLALAQAQARAEAMRRDFAASTVTEALGPRAACSLSIGLTELRPSGDSETELLRRADDALYEAKRQGRDRVVVAR